MITANEARAELLRRAASHDLLAYLRYCWWMPGALHVGRHTRGLCARLTRAVADFRRGVDTYLVVSMPFRHGKSDIVSRALPGFFLGACRDLQPNVIMSGYGSSLVKGFSSNVQSIVQGEAYRRVFPGVEIDPDKNATDEWRLKGSVSSVYAQGLGGSITGKGGNLIIVDDYCKNAEEAESETTRQKTWESFKTDLCTRTNAPAHIILVCATRWHEDDLVGRLYAEMERNPEFPRWESLVYPATKEGPDGWETLFPEHYRASWYAMQRAQLGPYRAAALLDCEPKGAGNALFREEWLQFRDGDLEPAQVARLRIAVFVDGAKSKAAGSDFTCAWTVGRATDGRYIVLDAVHARLNLAEKIECVFGLVRKWGGPRRVSVWWEQVGPMSDVEALRIEMTRRMYRFEVRELRHGSNKDFRIKRLVVPLSNGDVELPRHVYRQREEGGYGGVASSVKAYDAIWEFVHDEYLRYTGVQSSVPHDDMLDCLSDITDPEVIEAFTPPDDPGAGEAGRDDGRANTSWRPF